jgi:hypothetical protein
MFIERKTVLSFSSARVREHGEPQLQPSHGQLLEQFE